MSVGQMLAHCNVTYEMVYDDIHPKPGAFAKFLLKLFVKKAILSENPINTMVNRAGIRKSPTRETLNWRKAASLTTSPKPNNWVAAFSTARNRTPLENLKNQNGMRCFTST